LGLTKDCENRKYAFMMEPANTIIAICGGFQAVAEMTGRSEVRVRRWTYSKEKGGTDGLIPSDMAKLLLSEARARGIALTPEHFFPEDAAHSDDLSDGAAA
jgi:hypothetical protein